MDKVPFTFSGLEKIKLELDNLKKIEISWPTPKVFFENGSVINGYKKELILPIFFYKEKSSKKIDFKLNFLN